MIVSERANVVLLPVMLVNVCKVEVVCVEVRGMMVALGGEMMSFFALGRIAS